MRTTTIILLLITHLGAYAQWSSNPSVNNAVCNFAGNQLNEQMISDGAGGAIITWSDGRNGTQDIYAQRIDASGNLQWNVDGIAICNAASDQYSPRLTSDGSGGAIIVWYDNRNGNWDIYTQHINAGGVVQWTTDGVAICTQPGAQNAQQLITDGAGGAIIVWSDGRVGGPNADIYAQRINASGTVLWTADGSPVCTAFSLQNIPAIVSDGAGGAIIAWEDWRNFSQVDIYAQRISFNGFTNWSFNGVPICTEPNAEQSSSKIVSDGAGGAIMCWQDKRNFSSGIDIYAQKVNASGTVQWIWDGVAVCGAPFIQAFQQMVADGTGGAIIVWEDRRVFSVRDIYAQRINTSGVAQWTVNGIVMCDQVNIQSEPQIITRPSGGAIIIWTDSRTPEGDIYAQSITLAGAALWTANGVPVANESHSQFTSQLISDGADGAIIAWQDLRSTTDYDIYSSKLFSNGTLPVRLLDFTVSNSFGIVTLQWKTDNELNNRGFEIQRSSNGTDWHPIGFVDANTTGAGIKNYHWNDPSPLSGKSFYRLKQIDKDNRFEYTKVLSVTRNTSVTPIIYPNPASEIVNINFGRTISNGKLQLYNNSGQLILTRVIASQSSLQLNVKHISKGIYTLYLKSGEGDTTCRLMIE